MVLWNSVFARHNQNSKTKVKNKKENRKGTRGVVRASFGCLSKNMHVQDAVICFKKKSMPLTQTKKTKQAHKHIQACSHFFSQMSYFFIFLAYQTSICSHLALHSVTLKLPQQLLGLFQSHCNLNFAPKALQFIVAERQLACNSSKCCIYTNPTFIQGNSS